MACISPQHDELFVGEVNCHRALPSCIVSTLDPSLVEMNFDVVTNRVARWQTIAFFEVFAGFVADQVVDLDKAIFVEIFMTNFGDVVAFNRGSNELSGKIRFEILTDLTVS